MLHNSSLINKALFNQNGNVLISDQFNNRVIEVTKRGEIVWSYGLGPTDFTASSILGVNDALRIGQNTLMVGTGILSAIVPTAPFGIIDSRVIIVNKHGEIVWQYGKFGLNGNGFNLLNRPVHCIYIHRKPSTVKRQKHISHKEFHLNGMLMITDQGNNRIIMVNKKKEITWQYPGPNTNPQAQLNNPTSAELLENGNVLIADGNNNRAIEIGCSHQIIAIYNASNTLGVCSFASRLPTGNTLLSDSTNSRVVEVNENDTIVWQHLTNNDARSVPHPESVHGLRLKMGDTLICDQFNNRVIQINEQSVLTAFYGLPLVSGPGPISVNNGYDLFTTQLGLYCPHDAKIIGDYTGITKIINV